MQPVILGLEHGVTFAASDDDAFTLNAAIAGQIKDCQVRGYPLILRSALGLSAASRAAQGGSKAFMDATKYLVSNMLRSITKKLEIEMFYGQASWAAVASATAAPNTIVIKTSEWAPGIWAGAENMPLDIYDSLAGTTFRSAFTVVSVDMATRTITLNANPVAAGVVAGDFVFHGFAHGKEFPGIHQILSQQTGSLFNINVANYSLFRGNLYDANTAALSFTKMNLAAARAVEKGADGKLVAFVNPRAWANMLQDQAALRMYDQSYSPAKIEQGSKEIMFHSQNGDIEIVSSIYIKEGYCYILSMDDWSRVGSSDVTFKRPGYGDNFFRELENAAGYELRCWTDQAVFCHAPGRSVLVYNIVNSN